MNPKFDNFNLLRESVNRPLQLDLRCSVWIFGAGSFGQSLCQAMTVSGIEVAGFVETNPKFNEILNKPVLDWKILSRDFPHAQLALGIFNRDTPFNALIKIAEQAGYTNLLMPWDTYDKFAIELGWRFWLSKRKDLISSIGRIEKVALRLADQESRDILFRITAFRLGLDIEFASYQSKDKQYFNDISLQSLHNKEINYIDCGAFNGDTYIELLSLNSIICKQSYLMEPDPENFANLVTNVNRINRDEKAICLPMAASDKYEILSFSSGKGEGGKIGKFGNTHVAAVALDQLLPNLKVDFIKIDVEGAELQVLNGSKKLINRFRPVLAISLYHNPVDLYTLPERLFQISDGYEFFVRQHQSNSFDSVLYAIPRDR